MNFVFPEVKCQLQAHSNEPLQFYCQFPTSAFPVAKMCIVVICSMSRLSRSSWLTLLIRLKRANGECWKFQWKGLRVVSQERSYRKLLGTLDGHLKDEEMKGLRKKALQFYQNKVKQAKRGESGRQSGRQFGRQSGRQSGRQPGRQSKSKVQSHIKNNGNTKLKLQTELSTRFLQKQTPNTKLITPILTFKESHSNSTRFHSPFQVSLTETALTTITPYPSLSSFGSSVQISIMIHHSTPSWLAIGLSVGHHQYGQNSSRHLLAISNGWLSNRGQMERSKIRFQAGDRVQVKWDKGTQLLEWRSRGQRHAVKMPNVWNQQVYLCIVMYYKDDSISIIA